MQIILYITFCYSNFFPLLLLLWTNGHWIYSPIETLHFPRVFLKSSLLAFSARLYVLHAVSSSYRVLAQNQIVDSRSCSVGRAVFMGLWTV